MVEVKGRVCAQIKALPESSSGGPFEGDLSTYGNIGLGGDICEAGCFDRNVAEMGTKRPLLWQHRDDDPIGSFDVVSTEGTLRIKGEFGEMTCHTYNVPSPDNPKTSYLASLSAIAALHRIVGNEGIGI